MSARKMTYDVLLKVDEQPRQPAAWLQWLDLFWNVLLYLGVLVLAIVMGTIAANVIAFFAGWVNLC